MTSISARGQPFCLLTCKVVFYLCALQGKSWCSPYSGCHRAPGGAEPVIYLPSILFLCHCSFCIGDKVQAKEVPKALLRSALHQRD